MTKKKVVEETVEEVTLKLPCTATDCNAVPMNLITKPKVTVYVIDMKNGNDRFGTTSWGQKFIRKMRMSGREASILLNRVKDMEPVGVLEVSSSKTEDVISEFGRVR